MTLVELMTVVAIIAIFAVLAGPSFREFFEKARVRGAADSITALLSNARAEAVKRDRNVAIAVGGTTDAWCVGANMAADPANAGDPIPQAVACDCAAGTCALGDAPAVVFGSGFRGVSVSAVGDSVIFSSKLGTLDIASIAGFDPLAIQLTSESGHFSLQVGVSALGHVRTCIPSGFPSVSGYSEC
ncbi:MAG: GspH/FimT family pseudopilin [Xanthomonadales bacterium]|nr:GspH/FimT family pseudopilin [Xanthomonadales bacterium]